MSTWLAAIALSLLACGTVCGQLVEAGDPAPAFELEVLGGGSIASDDFRGQIVVIAFLGYN